MPERKKMLNKWAGVMSSWVQPTKMAEETEPRKSQEKNVGTCSCHIAGA